MGGGIGWAQPVPIPRCAPRQEPRAPRRRTFENSRIGAHRGADTPADVGEALLSLFIIFFFCSYLKKNKNKSAPVPLISVPSVRCLASPPPFSAALGTPTRVWTHGAACPRGISPPPRPCRDKNTSGTPTRDPGGGTAAVVDPQRARGARGRRREASEPLGAGGAKRLFPPIGRQSEIPCAWKQP